jgi:hypothetical protein
MAFRTWVWRVWVWQVWVWQVYKKIFITCMSASFAQFATNQNGELRDIGEFGKSSNFCLRDKYVFCTLNNLAYICLPNFPNWLSTLLTFSKLTKRPNCLKVKANSGKYLSKFGKYCASSHYSVFILRHQRRLFLG